MIAPVLVMATGLGLAGCTGVFAPSDDDTTHVMASLLTVLTADHQPVCVDGRTRGKPLDIFKTMLLAPDAARRPLAWFTPGPLRPQNTVSRKAILNEESADGHVVLAMPKQPGPALSRTLQGQLNAAANQLSFDQDDENVIIAQTARAPMATVRWWIRNRLDPDCTPVYTVSNPILARNIAFVSVTAGHWGTTYAFHKDGVAWAPIAQWANWIY